MSNLSILQQGNIYFFYRPKVQHEEAHSLEDVQRFFIVLRPQDKAESILMVVGRKHLPVAAPYFSFVEKIFKKDEELIEFLQEEHYHTATQGERDLPAARCLAEGRYLIVDHNQHTHLCYHLEFPTEVGEVQKQFNIDSHGEYLITVKNPNQSSPTGIGLPIDQKAKYSEDLISKLGDYRFIPLNPPDFLDYEGAELLLIDEKESKLTEIDADIEKCLDQIKRDSLFEHFKAISSKEALTPLLEKKWK